MNREKILFGDRVIVCDSLDVICMDIPSPFAVLLPAVSEKDCAAALALVPEMLSSGCIEFCSVGILAEILQDKIDIIIEDKDVFEIVTTCHFEMTDAYEYFIFAAGGASINMLALILNKPDLMAGLREFLASV